MCFPKQNKFVIRKALCYISTILVSVWPKIRKLDSDTFFFSFTMLQYCFCVVYQDNGLTKLGMGGRFE